MKIILEIHKHGIVSIDTAKFSELTNKGDPVRNPEGKTFLDVIKEDALNGTDKTGWRKYIKVLDEYNILSKGEIALWRNQMPNVEEKPIPKQA